MQTVQIFGAQFAASGVTLKKAISATLPGVETEEGVPSVTAANTTVVTKEPPTLYKWGDVEATFDMSMFDTLQKLVTSKTRSTRNMEWTITYPEVGTLNNYWARVKSVSPENASAETNNHRVVCRAILEFCGNDNDGNEVSPDFSAS